MWQSSNSDVDVLLNTIKFMAVTLSRDGHKSENDHQQSVGNDAVKSNNLVLTSKAILPSTKIVDVRSNMSNNKTYQKNDDTHHENVTEIYHGNDNNADDKRDNILPDAELPVKWNSTIPYNVSLTMTTSTKPLKTNNTESLLQMVDVGNASDTDDIFKKTTSNEALMATNDTSKVSKLDAQTASIINKPSQNDQILDSASYYGLSFYIQQQFQEGKDVVFIPTWISHDTAGDVRHNNQLFHSYNTIDLTTTASVCHTLVVSHINGLIDIESDHVLKKILLSSLRLLAWYVSHPQELNTFLGLSRFPSRIQFYWLVSRVAFHLQSEKAKSRNKFHFAKEEIEGLLSSLQKTMTYSILERIVDGGLGADGKTRVFIDDFIGVDDIDSTNSRKVTGDDRLFASAMAINTLIATWTVQGIDGKLKFINGTDDSVRIAVNSLVNYVSTAVGDAATLLDNAFMTDQVKSCHTFSALFPSNVVTNKDGKPVQTVERSYKLRYGVKGFFPWDSYQKELDRNQGRHRQSKSSDELNSQTSFFHYWSSHAYTKAACVLGISQSANLQIERN